MNLLILVVDDEPDVEMLFRQHFRRDLRERRFTMEFAQSGGHVRYWHKADMSSHCTRKLWQTNHGTSPLLRICRKCEEGCHAPIQFIQVIRAAG